MRISQVCTLLLRTNQNDSDVEEMFTLPEKDSHLHGDIRRIHYEADLRQEQAGIFTVWLEDHTVGHALRRMLHRNPNVVFAGYRIPHPLEHKMIIRVQTRNKETPLSAMKIALRMLYEQSQKMAHVFDKAMTDFMKQNASMV